VVCVLSGLIGFASILQDSFGWDASDEVRLIFGSAGYMAKYFVAIYLTYLEIYVAKETDSNGREVQQHSPG
jgi:hypothetical protein